MHPVISLRYLEFKSANLLAVCAFSMVALGALHSESRSPTAQTPAVPTNPTIPNTLRGPMWWHLVPANIQDSRTHTGSIFSTKNALDLMLPEGWKVVGQVEWPTPKGSPSLKFDVDSPDGLVGLSYLGRDSWSWSDDANTRATLQVRGDKVEPLPQTQAADYLRTVLLPKLRPSAQVIAIEPLPKITDYLTQQLQGTNTAAQTNAEQTHTAIPKSTGDAARAHITYQQNGVPVEEWVNIAVEHLQQHADNTPPRQPDETFQLYVAPSGPMIDTLSIVECDIFRAPQGKLEQYSPILATVLATLHQDSLWTSMVSDEYWQGKFNDQIIYFTGSYFGGNEFVFHAADGEEYVESSFMYAWTNDKGNELVVTDTANFNPNGKVGTTSWKQLKPANAQ